VAQAESRSAGRLHIERPRGALASGVFADRVIFDGGGTRIVAERFGARLRVLALLHATVDVEPLSIDALSISSTPGPAAAASGAPRLPVALRIAGARIARVDVHHGNSQLALRDVAVARFELGALRTISAALQLTLVHERFPAAAKLELGGTLEHLNGTVSASIAGAQAELRAALAPFAAQPIESLELRASGVELQRLVPAAPQAVLAVELKASAAAGGAQGTLSVRNAMPGPIDAGRLPVASFESRLRTDGQASASFEGARLVLAGGAILEGRGEASRTSANATLRAKALNLRALHSRLRSTSLDGTLYLAVSGDSQTLRASLSQQGIRISAEAERRGNTIQIAALHAEAGGGEVSGSGVVRLGSAIAVEAKLALARFDPSAFGDYPAGSVNGTLDASGTLGDAPQGDVRWTVERSTFFDLPLETQGRAHVAPKRVTDAQAVLRLGETRVTAHGGFGRPGDELAIELRAGELSEFAADIAGRLTARGALRGAWDSPQGELSADAEALGLPGGIAVERASLRLAGSLARHGLSLTAHAYDSDLVAELRGGVQGETWSGEVVSLASTGTIQFETVAPSPLSVSRERIALGRLEARLASGRLLVNEVVRTRDGVRSSGEFNSLRASSLLAALNLGERLRSTLLLDGDWSMKAAPSLDGTLRVRRSQGDLTVLGERPLDLGLEAVSLDARFTAAGIAAKMDIAARMLSGALGGQIGRAPGKGGLGLGADSAIVLQGNLELASLAVLAGPYVPEGRVEGKLSAEVEASGTLGAPQLAATLRGEGLSLDLPPYGVYLRDGRLVARIENDVAQVEQFSVRGGQGTFSAKGSLPLRLADGNAKLAWQAQRFTVLDRENMRLVASGQGEAAFDGKKLSLTGELRADRGSLEYAADRLPKLDDDIVVEGEPRRTAAAKTPLPIALNIDLDLGDELTIAMRGLEGKLAGRINLKTTPEGELRAYGELHAVRATYLAYGQRLRVDPGIVIFDGPIDNPALQITAWRRNQAVEAGVQLSGTVRAPRVQLVSQPPVPENEKLSWLVLGRAPTDVTRADIGLLQAAAGALLTRGDTTSMPLDRRLARTFGLDEITLRGSSETEDRVVAFGKRLSDKLYVSYEQGLGAVASNLVKLDYSISRRWSVRAETGTSSGGGLFYRFSWD
jgi:translocation and assembly module TamB